MTIVSRLALPQAGTIIVLNGASSSGKTSVARSLQALLPEPYQHLQLDAFRAMEPPGYWTGWEQRQAQSDLQLAALCRAMAAALVEYSRHGQHVVFDTALTNRDAWRYTLEALVGLPVFLIGITCEAEELARREKQRGDRPAGLAVGQFEWIHRDKHYDLMVDTTRSPPEHCARQITTWVNQRPAPRAFETMRSQSWVREQGLAPAQ